MKKKLIKKNKSALLFFVIFFTGLQIVGHGFQITSIHNLLKTHPELEYIKCYDIEPFEYNKFPLSRFPELQPNNGLFSETFILKIPNGQACSATGLIKIENNILLESIPTCSSLANQIQELKKIAFENVQKITGKVAVITTAGDICYFHWIYNVLGRLALLETQNIEYDWLYVACDKPFMRETLTLWGIDPAKIIQPFGQTKYIEADELIVPSCVGTRAPESHQHPVSWIPLDQYCQKWNIVPTISLPYNTTNKDTDIIPQNISIDNYFHHWAPLCSSYFYPWIIDVLRNKFLPAIKNNSQQFSKKVFISRSDCIIRKTVNEDEIFSLFEAQGFKRYVVGKMSIADQIALFNNADIIVAAHGSALVNSIFCNPSATIIEIFQGRSDSCFYYLSQTLHLNHYCIQTIKFNDIYGHQDTSISPTTIQNFIKNNASIFNEA